MQDINGYERFIGLLPGCYSMGVSHPETFVAGANLVLNSAEAPLTSLTLYGKSEQETTTGAQLNNGNMSNLIGSTTGVIVSSFVDVSIIIPIQGEEDYTISYKNGEKAITFHCTTEEYPAEGVEIVDVYTGSSGIQVPEKTMHTSSRAKYLVINVSINKSELIKNAMLNLGTTALPWEPYTGGTPSPSPDYPQEIKSVGDSGTVNVTLSDGGSQSQTLPVQTPNGLPGIPVSSGGNYTDADGQQWVCDEVDFKRGKYVQRVAIEQKNGNFRTKESPDAPGRYYQFYILDTIFKKGDREAFCNIASWALWGKDDAHTNTNWLFALTDNGYYISPPSESGIESAEELNNLLNSLEFPVVFVGQLATPIETDLSAEEIAAYKALHTYTPTTTVSNDAAAWMQVGYYGLTTIQKLEKEAIVINGGKS